MLEELFLKVLNISLTSSWLVPAVLAVRLLFKKGSKEVLCLVWALLAFKLLCPFSIESAVSLVPSAEPVPQEIIYEEEPKIDSGIGIVNDTVNPVISEMGAVQADGETPMQKTVAAAAVVWLIGGSAMLIYAAASYLYLLFKTRIRVTQADGIFLCDNIADPFILGLFNPKIFLPTTVDAADAEYIIAHEEAHLRRRDHLWKPLGFLLLSIHWFNPLMWAAYLLLCKDIELACDERVLKDLGTHIKKAYSTALINCSTPRSAISACPLAFGEVGVKERVMAVLKYKKHAAVVAIFLIIIITFVAAGFLTSPHQGVAELLEPGSGWQCTNYDSEFFVDEDGVISGWLTKDGETIDISIGYNEKNAEIFDHPFELIDGSGSPGMITAKIKIKDDKLVLNIINDQLGLGVKKLVYERMGNINNYFAQVDCPVGEDFQGVQLNSVAFVYNNSKHASIQVIGEPYRILLGDKLQIKDGEKWRDLGKMQKIELTEETFDRMFTSEQEWYNDESCEALREGNELALELRTKHNGTNELYILLRQVDGIHYMVYGQYGDTPEKDRIFWIKQLNFLKEEPATDNSVDGAMLFREVDMLVYNESPDPMVPSIIFDKNESRFQFYWSALSSYIAIGTYEQTGDRLILTTDDDYKNVYVFEKTDEGYAFVEAESANIPKYKYSKNGESVSPVPDGAVFKGEVTIPEKDWMNMTDDMNRRVMLFRSNALTDEN
ncbi:MAG: hypothetical protein IJO96_03610 [Oscillospiraceae bacterium]|nr:hypothetical protein [Oscillospiraceae bacterium]